MKNFKHQKPNTRETPNTRYPDRGQGNGDASEEWVLREEPVTKAGEKERHPFDLEERTAVSGEHIVRFAKRIPRSPVNDRLIAQMVGAGTSVGANFCEANDCVSKKDFRNSAKRCLKEAKETRFFLRMIVASEPALAEEARTLPRGHRTDSHSLHHVPQMKSTTPRLPVWFFGFGVSLMFGVLINYATQLQSR